MTNTLTKHGNTVGFTAAGETVVGRYQSKLKGWTVDVLRDAGESPRSDLQRTFVTRHEAETYAASLIDATKTEELAWWNAKPAPDAASELRAIRKRLVASGAPLLDWDGIEAEVHNRR